MEDGGGGGGRNDDSYILSDAWATQLWCWAHWRKAARDRRDFTRDRRCQVSHKSHGRQSAGRNFAWSVTVSAQSLTWGYIANFAHQRPYSDAAGRFVAGFSPAFWRLFVHYCRFSRAQELCQGRGGRPGLPFLLNKPTVSVDVKQHFNQNCFRSTETVRRQESPANVHRPDRHSFWALNLLMETLLAGVAFSRAGSLNTTATQQDWLSVALRQKP